MSIGRRWSRGDDDHARAAQGESERGGVTERQVRRRTWREANPERANRQQRPLLGPDVVRLSPAHPIYLLKVGVGDRGVGGGGRSIGLFGLCTGKAACLKHYSVSDQHPKILLKNRQRKLFRARKNKTIKGQRKQRAPAEREQKETSRG
jgi:hypothetical protein